jgi:hypothetical protein
VIVNPDLRTGHAQAFAVLLFCPFAFSLFFKNEKHSMAAPTVGASGAIDTNQKRSAE